MCSPANSTCMPPLTSCNLRIKSSNATPLIKDNISLYRYIDSIDSCARRRCRLLSVDNSG